MDFVLPELGEGVYEAELVSWLVKPGERVKRGQNLMEVLTDKATMEVPSPFAGTIKALQVEPGEKIKVGDLMLNYEPAGQGTTDGEPATAAKATKDLPAAVATTAPTTAARTTGEGHIAAALAAVGQTAKAAPSVRLLARQMGIDLGRVQGSGPEGRILVEDLNRFLTSDTAKPQAARRKRHRAPTTASPARGSSCKGCGA
jgi:2-oxoisovalerate dehydrogenase E2 component (dihydrolipoyl transacylase)